MHLEPMQGGVLGEAMEAKVEPPKISALNHELQRVLFLYVTAYIFNDNSGAAALKVGWGAQVAWLQAEDSDSFFSLEVTRLAEQADIGCIPTKHFVMGLPLAYLVWEGRGAGKDEEASLSFFF